MKTRVSLKYFVSFCRLTEDLQVWVVVENAPTWMTKGKTTLIQRDSDKGNAANNYCPMECPPLMWKLLTSILVEKVYGRLCEKNVLPDEQMRCRNDSRGTKIQLMIDNQILKHCKKHQRHLAMRSVDYKKAYDMVSHHWMIKAMKMVGIANNIKNLFKDRKEIWRTEMIARNESFWKIDTWKGILQVDSFSHLLFVVVL